MSEAKWTKAPWAAVFGPHKYDARVFAEIRPGVGDGIAMVEASDGADEPTIFPFKENTLLMAAAPDLYTALEAFVAQDTGVYFNQAEKERFDVGRTALAKARGEA